MATATVLKDSSPASPNNSNAVAMTSVAAAALNLFLAKARTVSDVPARALLPQSNRI